MMEKRNNYVQTILLRRFRDFMRNCWQPTAVRKSDTIFLLTRLYGCVAEETCKPAESLPVLRW